MRKLRKVVMDTGPLNGLNSNKGMNGFRDSDTTSGADWPANDLKSELISVQMVAPEMLVIKVIDSSCKLH